MGVFRLNMRIFLGVFILIQDINAEIFIQSINVDRFLTKNISL